LPQEAEGGDDMPFFDQGDDEDDFDEDEEEEDGQDE